MECVVVHRESSSLLGPLDPSFRALSGRLKFAVRRHKFNKDSRQVTVRSSNVALTPTLLFPPPVGPYCMPMPRDLW